LAFFVRGRLGRGPCGDEVLRVEHEVDLVLAAEVEPLGHVSVSSFLPAGVAGIVGSV